MPKKAPENGFRSPCAAISASPAPSISVRRA